MTIHQILHYVHPHLLHHFSYPALTHLLLKLNYLVQPWLYTSPTPHLFLRPCPLIPFLPLLTLHLFLCPRPLIPALYLLTPHLFLLTPILHPPHIHGLLVQDGESDVERVWDVKLRNAAVVLIVWTHNANVYARHVHVWISRQVNF